MKPSTSFSSLTFCPFDGCLRNYQEPLVSLVLLMNQNCCKIGLLEKRGGKVFVFAVWWSQLKIQEGNDVFGGNV